MGSLPSYVFRAPEEMMFPEEKVRNEVAVMTFLKKNTNIPVPGIIHYGMGDESPAGLGPFILMEYVEMHPIWLPR